MAPISHESNYVSSGISLWNTQHTPIYFLVRGPRITNDPMAMTNANTINEGRMGSSTWARTRTAIATTMASMTISMILLDQLTTHPLRLTPAGLAVPVLRSRGPLPARRNEWRRS